MRSTSKPFDVFCGLLGALAMGRSPAEQQASKDQRKGGKKLWRQGFVEQKRAKKPDQPGT